MKTTIKLALTIFCFLPILAFGSDGHKTKSYGKWYESALVIEKNLEEALSIYKDGDIDDAMEKVADAYFGQFENEDINMEIAVRTYISLKDSKTLEKGFSDIRKDMYYKKSFDEIKKMVETQIENVKTAAKTLDKKKIPVTVGYN